MDTHTIGKRLTEILNTEISIKSLRSAASYLAALAEVMLPGADGPTKKAWAKTELLAVVERYDQLIPLVGNWLELEPINAVQKAAVDMLVEWAWAELQVLKALGKDAVVDAAELPPGALE